MALRRAYPGLSDLELEVELDMEGEPPEEEGGDDGLDDQELDEEMLGDDKAGEEPDDEAETVSASVPVGQAGYRDREHAERLFELSQSGMESEHEIAREVGGLLREIEDEVVTEHLFGLGSLAKKKLGQLARGVGRRALANLRSRLTPMLKAAVGPGLKAVIGATPQGQAALAALKAIGFESAADMPDRLTAFERTARMAREAYEQVAQGLSPQADEPQQAADLANRAYTAALKRARAAAPLRGGYSRDDTTTGRGQMVRRIRLQRGETLIIRRD